MINYYNYDFDYEINYETDWNTWDENIKYAEYISTNMSQSIITSAIKYAVENNNYENYPDSDSHASINTEELNEIHYNVEVSDIEIKKNINKKKMFHWLKCCFF